LPTRSARRQRLCNDRMPIRSFSRVPRAWYTKPLISFVSAAI
jgi:hypothetical protein